MSVLSCGRRHCRNIMCTKSVRRPFTRDDYICDDCYEELKEIIKHCNDPDDVTEIVYNFMDYNYRVVDRSAIDEAFNSMIKNHSTGEEDG